MTPILLCLLLTADGPTPIKARADEPVPTALAVIRDGNGGPPSEAMPLGEAIVFSAKQSVHGAGPKSVMWKVEPAERDARKFITPDGLTVFVPTGVKPVEIRVTLAVASGDTVDCTSIRVKCGEGGLPPPDPTPGPTPPKPDPKPPTPLDRQLYIGVSHPLTITVDRSLVIYDIVNRAAERHVVGRFGSLDSSANGKRVVADTTGNGVAFYTLNGNGPGELLAKFPIPATVGDFNTLLRKYTSR